MSEETTTVYQSCSTQFNTTDGLDGLLQCIADGSAAVRCVVCVRVLFVCFCVCALSLALEVSDGLCLAEPLSFVVIPLIAIIVLSIYLSIYLSINERSYL